MAYIQAEFHRDEEDQMRDIFSYQEEKLEPRPPKPPVKNTAGKWHFYFGGTVELKMGHTAIACRKCGTITALENELVESMREYKCPACDTQMLDYELASMKLKYYFMMASMYDRHWGSVKQYEQFDYNIHLWPHYELKDSGGNGNLEGGMEDRKTN